MRTLICALICLGVSLPIAARGDESPASIERLVQSAEAAANAGKSADAEKLYREALEALERSAGADSRPPALELRIVRGLAGSYYGSGRYAAALPLYERAVRLSEAASGPEHPDTATSLNRLANAHASLGEYAKALPLLERSLRINEKALGPENPTTAMSLGNLGTLYSLMDEYAKALPLYERSLRIQEKVLGPEHPDTARTLRNLALLYHSMGESAKGLPLLERSVRINEKALGPEDPETATSLDYLANLYREMGEYAKALPFFERSLRINEKALGPEHPDTATSLGNLASLYESMGEYAKALPLHERSLRIHERVFGPEHPATARSLNRLANLYQRTGQYARALPLYERSLQIREKVLGPEHRDTGVSLNNLALLYQAMGEYAKALALYQGALRINEKALGPEHPETGKSLNNLALLYKSMGEYGKALPLYERSLQIREKVLGPEHPDTAVSLGNLASLYQSMGEYGKALPLQERSLRIREKVLGPEHPATAQSLNNLGALYGSMGEYAKELPLLERSLRINEKVLGPEHPATALSLSNLASLYESRGESAKALPLAERAFTVLSRASSPDFLSGALGVMRDIHAREGRRQLAILYGKQQVNVMQGMRAGMTSLERELQQSFAAQSAEVYQRLAGLLIEEGRLAEAQEVLAMLKEEEYFDFIRRDAREDPRRTQATYSGLEAPWMKRYEEIRTRLVALGKESEALRGKLRLGLTEAEQARRRQVEADLAVASRAFDAYLGELRRAFEHADKARIEEFGAKNLAHLEALQGTLAELGHSPVLLHYVVTEDKLHILLTTPEGVPVARQAAVGAKELNTQIAAYRELLQDPGADPLPQAQSLYRLLIGPVEEDLKQAGAQTLMVSLDGALRYLPHAALHDGKQYLVERYRVAIFTEATRDKLKDRPAPEWRLAGLGLTRAVGSFEPLPAVKEELEGLVKRGDARGILPGEILLDDAFTEEALRNSLDQSYPVLHIASHFVFTPGTLAESYLVLGDGSQLSLDRIKDGRFRLGKLDLITLSACETALGGGRDANGREIEGFGALAQSKGAKGVMATLWPVADASTALFMREFYRLRESATPTTKAEALRQAQLALLRGTHPPAPASSTRGRTRAASPGPAAYNTDPARPYAHPFFWAPFILMGNWL